MTPTHNPEESSAGHQALAGVPRGRARRRDLFSCSQANAPRLQRTGRSYSR